MRDNSEEVKVVYVDGNLNTGAVRSIRGRIADECTNTLTVVRNDGKITLGKQFIIKIEKW